MTLNDEILRRLEAIYDPAMTVDDLVLAAECEPYQAYMFIGRKLFEARVAQMSSRGNPTRTVADVLGTNQTQVSRTLRSLKGQYPQTAKVM